MSAVVLVATTDGDIYRVGNIIQMGYKKVNIFKRFINFVFGLQPPPQHWLITREVNSNCFEIVKHDSQSSIRTLFI